MSGKPTKDRVMSLRLTGDESAHLEQLAEVHGVDKSTIIRRLVMSAPLLSVRMLPATPSAVAGVAETSSDLEVEFKAFLRWRREGRGEAA